MRRTSLMVAIVTALCAAAPVRAAEPFPTRSIRIIVPLAAGGLFDLMARQMGEKIRVRTGQPVVVENMPGGNMIVGATACRRAAPDGYTVCMLTQNPTTLYPLLNAKPAYDPDTALLPVMPVGFQQQTLVAGASTASENFADFVRFSKAHPDKVNYASIGVGSDSHLILEWLKGAAGTNWLHVPFNSLPNIIRAFVQGDVHVSLLTSGAIMPQIESGQVKALLSRGTKRNPLLPNTPSFAEAGLPELGATSFLGLFAPAGVPAEVLAQVYETFAAAIRDPEFQQRYIVSNGFEPTTLDPEQFREFLRKDRAGWEPLVKAAGVRFE